MKKITLLIAVTAFLLLTSTKTNAQNILSYSFIPAAPMDSAPVYLILEAEFSTLSTFIFYNTNINGYAIDVHAYYEKSGWQVIIESKDTFLLGNLPCGQYALNIYTHLTNGSGSDHVSTSFNVGCATNVLNFKVFLQGFYLGAGKMRASLNSLGISSDTTATDSITVNLWSPDHLANAFADYSLKTILHKNGTATVTYPSSVPGHSYWIAVKHRNAMETWSAAPVSFGPVTSYDFTTGPAQAYSNGFNAPTINMGSGIYALYSGDVNKDGVIDAADMSSIDNEAQRFLYGYYLTDCTGDGNTDVSDMAVIDNNAQLFIFIAKPH